VRFRTAIKDPEELIFLCFAIASGLGLGADQRIPTVAAFGVIMAYSWCAPGGDVPINAPTAFISISN
jgi:hypothetical protein